MIYWAPFLHFYQPPTQFHLILKKVCNESYRPLLSMLLEHPQAKLTINICGVLSEMLNDHGAEDIIAQINKLAKNKQLEFVDSAKHHAILPLLPEREMRRQIELNHKTNAYFFKESYSTRGFFPPELCYCDELAGLLSKMGYSWVLASGIAVQAKWPLNKIYNNPQGANGIKVFYRDDIISNKISFHSIDSAGFIAELIKLSQGKEDIYVITAMDAETFGHHIQNWEKLFLAEVYEMIEGVADYPGIRQRTDLTQTHKAIFESEEIVGQIEMVTISELLKIFPIEDAKPPLPSSWSSSQQDILEKNYYPLWKDKHNPIHELQWEHINICFELVSWAHKLKSDNNKESARFYEIARALVDRAIHSCQFWWANKTRGLWDINLVNKGLMLQEEVVLNAFKSIKVSGVSEDRINQFYYKVVAARDIANKIKDHILI